MRGHPAEVSPPSRGSRGRVDHRSAPRAPVGSTPPWRHPVNAPSRPNLTGNDGLSFLPMGLVERPTGRNSRAIDMVSMPLPPHLVSSAQVYKVPGGLQGAWHPIHLSVSPTGWRLAVVTGSNKVPGTLSPPNWVPGSYPLVRMKVRMKSALGFRNHRKGTGGMASIPPGG